MGRYFRGVRRNPQTENRKYLLRFKASKKSNRYRILKTKPFPMANIVNGRDKLIATTRVHQIA